MLLIEANRAVPVARLIEAVWRDRSPENATAALQVLVSQLRRALDPERRVLLTHPGAYELRVDAEELDASLFEAGVRRGRRALRSRSHERRSPSSSARSGSGAARRWHWHPRSSSAAA